MAWRKSSVRVRSAPRPTTRSLPTLGATHDQSAGRTALGRRSARRRSRSTSRSRPAARPGSRPRAPPASRRACRSSPSRRSTGCGSRRRRGATGPRSSTSSGAGTCSARRRRGGRPPGTWRTPPTHVCCSRNYRLAPESKFPAPLAQRRSTPMSSCSRATSSPDHIIVAGDSSGGGLALALLPRAQGTRASAAGRRGRVVAVGRPRVRGRVDEQPRRCRHHGDA